MKELSYTKNTVYLICAGVISQVFGAEQKIILTRYLKEEGMAAYQSAFCVYSVFLTLACGGIPLAVTHFISGRQDKKNVFSALKFSAVIMCISGAVLSVVMFFSRDFFAAVMKERDAGYAIAALAPSVFAVSLGTTFKSCFEGHSNLFPCAVSQAAEAFVKLILVYILTSFLCVFSIKYAAIGGALAITLGEIFASFMLYMFFMPFFKEIKNSKVKIDTQVRKAILSYALPLTLYAIILSSLDLAENAVIRNSLLAIKFSGKDAYRVMRKYSAYTSVFDALNVSKRLSFEGASWLYGAFFGYAMTVIRFPCGLLRILSVPLFPLASKCFAQKNNAEAGEALFKIIKVMLSVSVPLCAIIVIFRYKLVYHIFGSCAYAEMLAAAAPILILSPLCSLFSTLEYASGRTLAPFLISFMSFAISIPLCAILIRIPQINILGAAYAAILAPAAEIIVHIIFISKKMGV